MISNRIRKKEVLNYKVILLGENEVGKTSNTKNIFSQDDLRFFMIYYKRKLC